MDLVYKNEKTLFIIAAIISAIFWLLLLVGTVGAVLLLLLFFFIAYLFAQSAFISYLKGTGVKITAEQMPDLDKQLKACAQKLNIEKIPDAYILRTDFFNALATRFLGRDFIVLFSDVVDALEDQPQAINFYIGHELGHIDRKHLVWGWFIAPALILPLLGYAYRRAEEYTCDRYGTACCETEGDLVRAISVISAGNSRAKDVNLLAYLKQTEETSGFWMSFNELTSDYPWLTKRMAAALAFQQRKKAKPPKRSILAWILSIFVPRLGFGAGAGILLPVAIIGILAAVAIPAYTDYVSRAKSTEILLNHGNISQKMDNFAAEQGAWPTELTELGYSEAELVDGENNHRTSLYEGGVIATQIDTHILGEEKFIIHEPIVEDGNITWVCYGKNIPEAILPVACRN